ncbi:MAG: FMN-binding negative transcriptional regulator [Pseudomonadota bacterium]
MHPSSIFHTDEDAARAIVRDNPLATLVTNGEDGPIVAIVPLVWSKDGPKLIGHVARTNRFWQDRQGEVLPVAAVFQAGDGYVSASAYPSKAEHGRVVPTWNYIAAEARGQLTFQTDANDIRASIEALSDQMEAERAVPWAVGDAPNVYIDKLARAIVAFEIAVTELQGVRKLSQNKTQTDRDGVVSDLMQQDANAQRVAAAMTLEPQA